MKMNTTIQNEKLHSSDILDHGKVRLILEAVEECCYPENVYHYESLEEMAETMRSQSCWAMGQVFVFAKSVDDFVIAKQIAPSSCEMLIVTKHGIREVLTAYRYEQEELLSYLRTEMAVGPRNFHRLAFAYPTSEAAEQFGHSAKGCYYVDYNEGEQIPFVDLAEAVAAIQSKGTQPHFWSLDHPQHRLKLTDAQRELIPATA